MTVDRTQHVQLIKISPKKTVEGFVGGGFSTIGMGLFVSIELDHEFLHCTVLTCSLSLAADVCDVRHPVLQPGYLPG